MPLPAREEAFCRHVAFDRMNQSQAYSAAFDTATLSQRSIANASSRLATREDVKQRIAVMIEGATAAALKKAALTLADSIAEAGEMLEGARAAGQYSAGVAAAKLRAQLAGHLVEKKEITNKGMLDDMDIEGLMAVRAEVEAKIQANRDAASMVGEAPEAIPAPVLRRVIA